MRRRQSGFTLIELVASALLSTMLMAALIGVVWSAVQESTRQRKAEITRWPTTQLVMQLRRDFQNARGMLITPSGVMLQGFLDQERGTGHPTLRVGRVRYQRVVRGDRGVLIRHRSGVSGSESEPVWFGFGGLQVEPLEQINAEDATLDQAIGGGLPPVPGALRVTLLSDRGQILWREVIRHHAG